MSFRCAIQGSIWLYRQLLCVYPADFRYRYGREMVQLFATQCHQIEERNKANWQALVQLWCVVLGDLLKNVPEEILMDADRNRRLIRIGVLFGLVAGLLGSINTITYPIFVGEVGEKVIAYVVLIGILALAFAAGRMAAHRSQRATTGLWIGLLVGVMTSLIANTTRVGFSIAFYDIVRHDPNEIRDWMHRGSGTFVQYLIDDRIGGYIYMTLGLGVICAVLGVAGGWLTKVRNLQQVG